MSLSSRHSARNVLVCTLLASANATTHAGFTYDAAASTLSINFQVAGTPASATFANAFGGAWYSPNSGFLGAVWEPTTGTHVGAPLTANWTAYGTSARHAVLGHLAANGIVNAIPVFNVPITSYAQSSDPGNLIPPGTLRIEFNIEAVATPGGFNVGQLPGFFSLAYNVPLGSFGDFRGELNYSVVNLAGAVVPLGSQIFDPTPGAAVLAGAGVAVMNQPGAGLNWGTVFFSPNPLLNGRLRLSGYVEWIVDNEAGPVTMTIESGGVNDQSPINDSVGNAFLLGFDQPTSFDTTGATTDDPDDDSSGCLSGKDLWYVIHAPAEGEVEVSLCDSTSFDSTISFYYLGNGPNLPRIDADALFAAGAFACNDDSCGASGLASSITLTDIGQHDWIVVRVAGYGEGDDAQFGAGSIVAHFVAVEPPCPGDLTGDGSVNGADLAALLGSWGGPGSADLNADGIVNGADLAAMLGAWGGCG